MEQILNPILMPDSFYDYEPPIPHNKQKCTPSYMRPTRSSDFKIRKKWICKDERKDRQGVSVMTKWTIVAGQSFLDLDNHSTVTSFDIGSTESSPCPEDAWFVDESTETSIVDESSSEVSIPGEWLAFDSPCKRPGITNPVGFALLSEDSHMEQEQRSLSDSKSCCVDFVESLEAVPRQTSSPRPAKGKTGPSHLKIPGHL